MKALSLFLLLISSLTLFAQTESIAGDYTIKFGDEVSSIFEYKLTLKQDGTFYLDYYSFIKNGIPPEKKSFGKGTWTEKNKVITFVSDKQKDLDEKYTLDLTNTKGRFITKSTRDKSDKIVKTQLQFLESEIPWLSRIKMLKI